MKAIVTKSFPGCADGDRHTQTFKEGQIITGDLAKVAIENGWAEEQGAGEKAKKPERNASISSAPKTKSGAASLLGRLLPKKTAKPSDKQESKPSS